MTHYRLSPSGSSIWTKCPGSIMKSKGIKDDINEEALSGTLTHWIIEQYYRNNVDTKSHIGKLYYVRHSDGEVFKSDELTDKDGNDINYNDFTDFEVQYDRVYRSNLFINYIKERVDYFNKLYNDDNYYVTFDNELLSWPGYYFRLDEWKGTSDGVIKVINKSTNSLVFVEIIDYKDGIIPVNVYDNTQLISYASGIVLQADYSDDYYKLKAVPCDVTVIQPKISSVAQSIRYSPELLIKKATYIAKKGHETYGDNPELNPGSHCKYCLSNKSCEVLFNYKRDAMLNVITYDGISDINEGNIQDVSTYELEKIYDVKDYFENVFNIIKEELEKRIEQGNNVQSYYMKPGRKVKSFEDYNEVESFLRTKKVALKDIYKKVPLSVNEVMNLKKLDKSDKEHIESLIQVKNARPSLKKSKEINPVDYFGHLFNSNS